MPHPFTFQEKKYEDNPQLVSKNLSSIGARKVLGMRT